MATTEQCAGSRVCRSDISYDVSLKSGHLLVSSRQNRTLEKMKMMGDAALQNPFRVPGDQYAHGKIKSKLSLSISLKPAFPDGTRRKKQRRRGQSRHQNLRHRHNKLGARKLSKVKKGKGYRKATKGESGQGMTL